MDRELYKEGGDIFESEFNEMIKSDNGIHDVHDMYDEFLKDTAESAYYDGLGCGFMNPAKAYFAVVEFYDEDMANEFLSDLKKYGWITS